MAFLKTPGRFEKFSTRHRHFRKMWLILTILSFHCSKNRSEEAQIPYFPFASDCHPKLVSEGVTWRRESTFFFFEKGSQSYSHYMRANFLSILCLPVDKFKSLRVRVAKRPKCGVKFVFIVAFFPRKVGLCGLKVACLGPNFSSEIEKWR